jgi:hypothetical protein
MWERNMATDWSGRTAALAYFEKALKAAKRFNDEDRDHMQEAVNALRRSQDHPAIHKKLNAAMAALREARDYILDNGDVRPRAQVIECIDDVLRGTHTRRPPP